MLRRDIDIHKQIQVLVYMRWCAALACLAACSSAPAGSILDAGPVLPDVPYIAPDLPVAPKDAPVAAPDVPAPKPDVPTPPADVAAPTDVPAADVLAIDATASVADVAVSAPDAAVADVPAACTTTTCASAADCSEAKYGAAVPCQIAVCEAGCCNVAAVDEGGACQDGDVCTTGESCSGGVCVGSPKACDDGDACTTDTCTPKTGACSHTAKVCPAPSACQSGVCDPKTGACGGAVKPGFCFVDGACVGDGTPSPDTPCKTCNALLDGTAWSANAGAYCDDGNACTFSDVCTIDGVCKGKGPPGCCAQDADCAPSADPCNPNKCNIAAGLCAVVPKSGCCVAGSCCDTASHSVAGVGTACSATAIGTEYQCVGADSQKRDVFPGCNGTAADGCSKDKPAFGAWQTLQTCGAGTACTPLAGGVPPSCEPTGFYGSCSGACGAKAKDGNCHCDASCTQMGDCCSDYMGLCGCSSGDCCSSAAQYPKAAGSQCSSVATPSQYKCISGLLWKKGSQPTCDGQNNCSAAPANLVWGDFVAQSACPAGTACKAAADGSAGKCLAISCAGQCGTALGGTCFCSPFCLEFGLCCPDFVAAGCLGVTGCGSTPNTCAGKCGGSGAGGCMCDADCELFGDCCPDKAVCGC